MIDLSKQFQLPEVGASVSFEQRSIISLVTGLAVLATIIILVITITKKL